MVAATAEQMYNFDEQNVAIRTLFTIYTIGRPVFNKPAAAPAAAKPAAAPVKEVKKAAPVEESESDSDDDFMASLSDDEEEDDTSAQELINRKNAEREAAKRATKKGPVAKSTLILDVKPEGAETDLEALAAQIKSIEQEGLLWGNWEKVPVAYGVNKIRIAAVVVDALVSTDSLQEEIEEMEGCQSTDIVAFNKL